MSRTPPATAAMTPPSLRGFLEGDGDPAAVLEPHLLLELANAAVTAGYEPSGERTAFVACARGAVAKGVDDPDDGRRVVFKAWELDACDDPAVYELLERHLSGSQLSEIVQVMERAEWTAIIRQLGRRLARIEAALGLEPLAADCHARLVPAEQLTP